MGKIALKGEKIPKKMLLFRNLKIFEEIKNLDGEKDHCRIIQLLVCYEFPWDLARALEIALFRTYASPRISALLDKTGEFKRYGQKRYDDTGVLIGEFLQNGYDSERGKRAIAQMNKIHSKYPIKNEDYIFVLSTFVLDPLNWLEKFGWRDLLENEKQAFFHFFYQVGLRMGLENIPQNLLALQAFSQAYQAENFVFVESNQNVADATVKIVENWYPKILRPFIKPIVSAMIDENMRKAFGYKKPSSFLRWILPKLLQLRKPFIRYINLEKSPTLLENSLNRTYPQGYTIEEISPQSLTKSIKSD
jgi:hypothetical protein